MICDALPFVNYMISSSALGPAWQRHQARPYGFLLLHNHDLQEMTYLPLKHLFSDLAKKEIVGDLILARMDQIIEKYQRSTGTRITPHGHSHHQEDLLTEMAMLRHQNLSLEMGIQRYLGEGIACLQYEELTQLEDEVQSSVARVRTGTKQAQKQRTRIPTLTPN
ncbi:hypothetical protein Ahy_A10g046785 isoform B [Arachis hypogaea]|uniref:K-box domain-containing protein n=1 Tax=Arachis hypogaea TaxID=3818 RepID=A0A445B0G5_ARAHY|nr:hypothetical protein Ahy_A10g046785 isoform B [Arachis hypogaea]